MGEKSRTKAEPLSLSFYLIGSNLSQTAWYILPHYYRLFQGYQPLNLLTPFMMLGQGHKR